ncbi:hypothetical protein [Pseudomonas sp.]|uniref:hypothetical protein n=1 Tax=Pseudomonas sp. TaxID=306 RepID=UPI002489F162|nr:hypothetical protein [Pseudomonas sp.]MDI1333222.1 hypothetical protein [Pseudomonas sp.]
MEIKNEKQKPEATSFIAEALTLRIQALVHLIKSDVIRAAISAKLGEVRDIKALYQLLSLAQTSIENSELIENKIKGGLVFNPFTGELISELDYHYAMEDMIEMMKGVVNNPAPKMNPKPPTV